MLINWDSYHGHGGEDWVAGQQRGGVDRVEGYSQVSIQVGWSATYPRMDVHVSGGVYGDRSLEWDGTIIVHLICC